MEEHFENVEDISDPSLMHYILARVDEVKVEDEEFIQILLEKQKSMIITWHQPWYQKGYVLTRPLQPTDENDKTFRTDSISHEEGKKIHKNWRKFRKMFGLPNKPICLARWRNKDRKKEFVRRFAISFLAQGLERNLYQVYRYIVAHYGSLVTGKFSQSEENMIKVCVYHNPKHAVPYLSAVLGRESRGIYKRISQMTNGKYSKKRFKWTLPLATNLVKLLMQHSGESELDNLKQRVFEKSVWLSVEQDIGQSYEYLQKFWYSQLHSLLFVKADVKIKKLRRRILKVLKLYPYKVWTDIRWKEVAQYFPDGFTHQFLNKTCYGLFYRHLRRMLKDPLEDIIDYGLKLCKSSSNKRLKTLTLNEYQELEVIKYDNKLKF